MLRVALFTRRWGGGGDSDDDDDNDDDGTCVCWVLSAERYSQLWGDDDDAQATHSDCIHYDV